MAKTAINPHNSIIYKVKCRGCKYNTYPYKECEDCMLMSKFEERGLK